MELILIVVAIVIENAVILMQLDVIFMRYYLTFEEYKVCGCSKLSNGAVL